MSKAPPEDLPAPGALSERFARLLRTEISDENPDAFGENVEVVLALAREADAGGSPLGVGDQKVLLRQLSRRFDARTGNQFFSRGLYQTFFSAVRARRSGDRARLDEQVALLARVSGLLVDEALAVRSLRAVLVELWGALTEGLPEDDEDAPEARMIAWRLFESILRGVVQVDELSTASRTFFCAVLPPREAYHGRLADERRRVLLEDFRFSVGDAYPRRPLLRRVISRSRALPPADRALLVQAVTASRAGDVEPFSHLLRHHAWILACGQGESSVYFEVVDALLDHLLERVFVAAEDDLTRVMRTYLALLRERHLASLRRWCEAMQRARAVTPLLADLLLEPYLLRIGLLDGAEEPGIGAMLRDWAVVQRRLETSLGYQGPTLDVLAELRAREQDWLHRRPAVASGDAQEGDEVRPAERADWRAMTRSRRVTAYDTFFRVPVVSEPLVPPGPDVPPAPDVPVVETGVPMASAEGNEGGANPFGEAEDEDALTEPFPRQRLDLFDAITRQIPVLQDATVDLSGHTTLILPRGEGGSPLHRAATIILPSPPVGEVEPGLHRARTLLFPVQSVPITRNEAICRRIDVVLEAMEGAGGRSSDPLRVELLAMSEEDRIIAEQYLAQIIERRMARLSRRLHAADAMSMVTLDDYAGSQLSAVLRRFVVSGYLQRVFLADCVSLYGEFLRRDTVDQRVLESVQIALFTVLNAHQDRLAFGPGLRASLLALGDWPAEQPLPSRLPYAFPEPVSLPADLALRMAGAGSPEAVFEVEYLLESQVQELGRTVGKVASLEIFSDLEVALSASGLTEETYLALATDLRGRVQQVVQRARGLFVHLEQVGTKARSVEQALLQLIGYGRGVWSACVFPALVFYAKMAFGARERE